MKKILLILLILISVDLFSQPQDGSLAPDFTMVDMNGNNYHLYDILDSGKYVIIDFFGTFCGPCWQYHQSKALHHAWEAWGPPGNNTLRIFMIECDGRPDSVIQGKPPSEGDWTDGTPFPILPTHLPNGPLVPIKYHITQEPTVIIICPDKRVKYMGFTPPDSAKIRQFMNNCPVNPIDSLKLITTSIDSVPYLLCNDSLKVYINVQNYGIKTINSFKTNLYMNGNLIDSLIWSGTLSKFYVANLKITSKINNYDGSYKLLAKTEKINNIIPPLPDSMAYRFTVPTTKFDLPFFQSFSNISFPYDYWTLDDTSYPNDSTWQAIDLTYDTALIIPFYNIPVFHEHNLIFPPINTSGINDVYLHFDVAASINPSTGYDAITIDYSKDCGEKWHNIKTYTTYNFQTAPETLVPFFPNDTQWKTMSLMLDSVGDNNMIFLRFSAGSTKGNNIFFRNIMINNLAGINIYDYCYNAKVYPNPSNGTFYLETKEAGKIEIYDITGKSVYNESIKNYNTSINLINVKNKTTGIYILKFITENKIYINKIIIN